MSYPRVQSIRQILKMLSFNSQIAVKTEILPHPVFLLRFILDSV